MIGDLSFVSEIYSLVETLTVPQAFGLEVAFIDAQSPTLAPSSCVAKFKFIFRNSLGK